MNKNNEEYLKKYNEIPPLLYKGFLPNKIWYTANTYLHYIDDSFERNENKESDDDINFWSFVHHNSYIAVELFLKSYAIKISVTPKNKTRVTLLRDIGRMDLHNIKYHVLRGHKSVVDHYSEHIYSSLDKYLTDDEFKLVKNMNEKDFLRGRYPFDYKGKDIDKNDALEWLNLARKLKDFKY